MFSANSKSPRVLYIENRGGGVQVPEHWLLWTKFSKYSQASTKSITIFNESTNYQPLRKAV